MTPEMRPPLWLQLQAVVQVVQAIRRGQSGTAALEAVASGIRPGVQALSFEVLRALGRAQGLRKLLAPRLPPPQVDALLCTALALLWRNTDAHYDAFTLVNQAVECAKRTPAIKAQAAFLNACLRRFLREREALVLQTDADPVARWNHPAWWVAQLRTDWPDQWQSILTQADLHPPLVLRVNARRGTPAHYLAMLQCAGMQARLTGQYGVTLESPCAVGQLPCFLEGWVSVQDSAAQLAAPLLLSGLVADRPLRVLDACAAPGGKTAHLLEISQSVVTALEIDPARCARIHETLARLGLHATVIAADAADVASWWDGESFDAVLLDAPCSASGIVRRHPDIRWLRRSTDIAQLAALQGRLLARLWPLLKPGGHLLYCTCSVFRAEGEQQVQAFLASNSQAVLLPSPGHLLMRPNATSVSPADNPPCDHDGFYYALLQKLLP
jgi:16S rRNA (cytosine967-C5)-methyltransferase